MTNSITKLPNGDFKVNTLEEFDRELKRIREDIEYLDFPMLKGKKKTITGI